MNTAFGNKTNRLGLSLLLWTLGVLPVTDVRSSPFFVTSGSSEAQLQTPGAIEGKVLTIDGQPLSNVLLNLAGSPDEVDRRNRSDFGGRFRFPNLPAGRYELKLRLEGFTSLTETVEVSERETTSLSLTLDLAPLTEEITVTATRSEQRLADVPNQVSLLTHEDIKRAAALTVDDLLKRVSSFSLFRRSSSLVAHPTSQGVSLRGIGASGVSRSLVMLDGMPHNDHFGNWVYWSKIPQSQIETIEVAEGGLSNLYGSSAMAGVINVATKKPTPRTISVSAQGGMRETANLDFFGSHQLEKFGFSAGGSLFNTGGYKMVRKEERGPVDTNFSSQHQTGNWRLEYSPSPNMTWFHNGRFFNEDRDNGTPLRENSTLETHLGGGLRAYTSDGSDWQINLFSHLQTFKSSFSSVAADRTSEALVLLQEVPSKDFGVNAQWQRHFSGRHLISIGGDTRWITADNEEEVFITGGPRKGFNIRDRLIQSTQTYAAAFFQDLITLHPRLTLLLGARLDYWRNHNASRIETLNITDPVTTTTLFPDTSETTVTPRAGLSFRASDKVTLRGSFHQGFRAPTLNELYRPFRVGNVQTNANENLRPERLTGAEVGFSYSITKNFLWRAAGFWNRLKDPISNVTLSVTEDLITRQRQNLGRSRARGIDTGFDYQASPRWTIRAHYLFGNSTIEEFPANPGIEGNRIPQVPKHRASLGIDYFNPALVNVSLMGRYESHRFDDDLNQLKLGSFFVADLTAYRPVGNSTELFLSVENLFNRRYAVQATPVELQGTPTIVTGGVRFRMAN